MVLIIEVLSRFIFKLSNIHNLGSFGNVCSLCIDENIVCPKIQNVFYFDNFCNYYQIGRYNHDIAFLQHIIFSLYGT